MTIGIKGFQKNNKIGHRWKKGEGIFIGEKNKAWKGNKAKPDAIHRWVERWKGKPKLCENCGTTTAKKYEWANIDHKYYRVLEDFIRLCTPCHRNYDKNRGVKIR